MRLINKNGLRFKLIVIFLGSLFISIFCGLVINSLTREIFNNFNDEIEYFTKDCEEIEEKIINANSKNEILEFINTNMKIADIFILDSKGNVILKNNKSSEKSFDLDLIRSSNNKLDNKEYNARYNILKKISNDRYILFSGILSVGDNVRIIFIMVILIFVFTFLIFTAKWFKYIEKLCVGLKEIGNGNLKYKVEVKGKDEISEIGISINNMSQKLYEQREKEKEIEKNKDIFMMNISHDLRTPLTSIIGYINLLKEQYKQEGEIKKYIDIIDAKANRLDSLINDFFEYSKLNNCEIELNRINISLNEFMRQVITGIIPLCKEKNLSINLSLPNYNINYDIDTDKMFRVMDNLLTNAIRYCNKNSEIKVSVIEENNKIIILVINQSDNLNQNEIVKIFDRFYRGDKARNTSNGGAGLGLAIAKSIIELHGGRIVAECENNKIYFKIIFKINPSK